MHVEQVLLLATGVAAFSGVHSMAMVASPPRAPLSGLGRQRHRACG